MGRAGRAKSEHLAGKLETIRKALGLTFEEMIVRLDSPNIPLYPASIYEYEKGRREPPLPVLLKYAHTANVYVEVLIDDELQLPERLPCRKKSEGILEEAGLTQAIPVKADE